MSYLEIKNLTMHYPKSDGPCLDNLSLSVEKGDIMVLLGSSGCGKSTLLKCVAGLLTPSSGEIILNSGSMKGIPAEKRPISMVFQKALLFNNMNVEQNISFSPRINHSLIRSEIQAKTKELIELLHLEGLEKRHAWELSGGQEQRVSLARALMCSPAVLLLDEPLCALDAGLKLQMEDVIRDINKKTGVTMLYVTHDQSEAAYVARKIALMHEGRIVQCDSPESFYTRPESLYAAEFFGCHNIIYAVKEGKSITIGDSVIQLELPDAKDGNITLTVRPEFIKIHDNGQLKGIISKISPQATGYLVKILSCGNQLEAFLPYGTILKENDNVSFDIDPHGVWVI